MSHSDSDSDPREISASITDLVKWECKKYQSKGLGLIVAWFLAINYIIFFPEILKAYWPETSSITNPFTFYYITSLSVLIGAFLITNLEYMIYYKLNLPFLERYKTNVDPWPWEENKEKWSKLLNKTIKTLFFNMCVFFPIALGIDVVSGDCPYRFDKESFPSLFEMIPQMAMCMFIEDFIFYWMHRILHTKNLYKYHKQHHDYVSSVACSALYADPVEFIFGNLLPSTVGPMILGKRMHFLTYLTYTVMVIHESHDGHSGYTFSWSPHRIIPFAFDAEFHIFHHWKYKGNYANYLSIWDRVFGTVNDSYLAYFNNKEKYLENYRKAQKERKSEGEEVENENPDDFVTKKKVS